MAHGRGNALDHLSSPHQDFQNLLHDPNIELNNAMKNMLLGNTSLMFPTVNQIPNFNVNMQSPTNQFVVQQQPQQRVFGLTAQHLYAENQAAAVAQQQQRSPQQQQQPSPQQPQRSPQQPMSGMDFLKSIGGNAGVNVPAPAPAPIPSSSLSVAASEFVPGFRKPEKTIMLYTYANFKRKSRSDDEMAINDVKTKLVKLFNSPQRVEDVMESAVETIKSWTTSINTYHQIVEDIFEFSIDDVNNPNFYPIGSKILNYLTLKLQPFGSPPLTFFDTIVHKCCREFDNCIRIDQHHPAAQERIKNVALMIADLFNTIKEGELRVFLFAEQVISLCLVLVQIRTMLSIETVAKVFLLCGGDLKNLVDDMRFGSIINQLIAISKLDLDSKTRALVENVIKLDSGGWAKPEQDQQPEVNYTTKWSGDDCRPVTNAVDWDDYATDDYDDEWLTEMLRFEEEDDFSDVEEDFKKFMEEAQKYKN